MTTPAMVPDTFIRKILEEFGMQWTHIAIFSGVGFSALGLDRYFNSGVWILGAIAGFTVVYFFRRQLPQQLAKVAAFALIAIVLGISVPIVLISMGGQNPLDFAEQHKTLSTAYLSLVLIIPGASIISTYRQQENVYGGTYPPELNEAIRKNIADAVFYRKKQVYKVHLVSHTNGMVAFETELSYSLVNRTNTTKKWSGGFAVAGQNAAYTELKVNGKNMDLNRPEYRTERGLRIDLNLAPNEEVPLKFVAKESFPSSGSDLLSSYTPATSLTVEVRNSVKDEIQLIVEALLPEPVEPTYTERTVVYESPTGVLPYQGFRLYWKPIATISQDRTELVDEAK